MPPHERTRVLFICTGNRARSQMAEGLLRHLAADRFEALSAGTNPGGLAPQTVEVMAEIGVDVSGQRSQHVDEFAREHLDYVIIVCGIAIEACSPLAHEGERVFWDVEDPSAAVSRGIPLMDALRAARDDLRSRVAAFVDAVAAGPDA